MGDQRQSLGRLPSAWQRFWGWLSANCNSMQFGAAIGCCMDSFVYLLGPVLVCLALVIIGCLIYSFFYVILPLMDPQPLWERNLHIAWVLWLALNVVWNYFLCVTTRNKGPHFDSVVRDLAHATNYIYPETPEEVHEAKREYVEKIMMRSQRRKQRIRWMLLGPQEWGFCTNSNQPKPPRSHYDHVMKVLVLNMDHYCPWMFNTVGYFNYRYFCNFLWYVAISLLYGACISFPFFRALHGVIYRDQLSRRHRLKGGGSGIRIIPHIPMPEERTAVAMTFMICISLGLAVLALGCFHLYLILTAQTTVEFQGNGAKRRRARKRGTAYINPYDLGWKKNWQQVYGSQNFLLSLCPSSRQPEFLPIPVGGKLERRRRLHDKQKEDDDDNDMESNRRTAAVYGVMEV